jgi:APA family basic amino acid/polyamine antiporter
MGGHGQSSENSSNPSLADEGAGQLSRRLGLFDMTMLVMGSVIGSGIFAVPHDVAGLVRIPALILGAWCLGGLVSLAGSFVYAELTRRRPDVGGQYAYLREAYHPAVAFVYGWSLLWVIQSGGMAFVAAVFARYFLELWHSSAHWFGLAVAWTEARWANGLVTTTILGILTLINCAGVRAAGTTQNIFMVLKIGAILVLVFSGLLATTSPAAPSTTIRQEYVWTAFAAAMVPILFAYGGWHTTTFMGGEVREPRRTLARALLLGVTGVIILYVCVNFVCLRVLGVDRLAQTTAPASDVMRIVLGEPGAVFISIGIAISAAGFLSQGTLTSPRVYYAMARDGIFFQGIAWVHPRTHVPVFAIILQGAVAAIIAVSGTFHQIVNYVMSVEMLFFVLTSLSLFVIRRNDELATGSRGFRMPGHPATTLVFAGVNLIVLVHLFYRFPANSAIGIGIALAGLPVYFLWRRRASRSESLAG